MGWRSAIRRLPLAGAGVAGAAVGHSIAYLIVAPQGRTRLARPRGEPNAPASYRPTIQAPGAQTTFEFAIRRQAP
ncbi:MAG TPA: hypothetical protein VE776_13520 [Actinomycetota bacterium]|jgi:hypothetical protein|nr:hypothetical protein [Actinomycetota bacterium]